LIACVSSWTGPSLVEVALAALVAPHPAVKAAWPVGR